MMYDRMWYIFKEELMQMHGGGGAMNIEDLLCMMNRIEIEENNNKKLLDFGMRMHPNT